MRRVSGYFYLFLFFLNAFIRSSALPNNYKTSDIVLKNIFSSISCSSLNVSTLQIITFDLFGALMSTESSLERNIAVLLPSLSSNEIKKFTNDWLDAYASYFGKSFSSLVTHQPFQWVIRSSLIQLLASFHLSDRVPEESSTFNELLSTWHNLRPHDGIVDVLEKLSKRYQIGLLSNGDTNTLKAALHAFPSSVNISLFLSSDYPVNCFKPCSEIYAQALNAVHGDLTKVFHVAGSAFDTNGARKFGIYSGALDSSAMHTQPQPCFAFDDIQQLLSFFNV
ncbi:hypothetical protein I4U23_023293 [Adineta vaga]|nr:hypothetical protein I4U23_023293 [Adineta vaga]